MSEGNSRGEPEARGMYTPDEKREMLELAREAIWCALRKEPFAPVPSHARLMQPAAAFVTLRVDNQLRGCIGYIESVKPLAVTVAEVAVKAACEDARFPPLQLNELGQLSVEISVLSPLTQIRTVDEIKVGTHGVTVAYSNRRALLLPQVADEFGFDAPSLVEAAIRKAGIPPEAAGSSDFDMFTFEAEVFSDSGHTVASAHQTSSGGSG